MRFRDAFLASLLILLVTIVTAEKSSPVVARPGRLLRKAHVDEANALDMEERGIKNWGNIQYWLAAGKSDDEVKKALKLEGLTGAALTAHPNYEKLQKFWFMRKSREMNGWLKKEIPPQDVWAHLGLERMSADQRKNSDELKKYVRYAKKFDDNEWKDWKKWEIPIHSNVGSPAEMGVRVQLWVKAQRDDSFVKKMLGIKYRPKPEVDPDYQYYLLFLQLTGRSA